MPNINDLREIGLDDIYDYGKSERLNRKLGHITILSKDKASLMNKIKKIKK